MGIEIPYDTKIERGLKILHGQSLVINKNTIIGSNCIFRHSTTIGNNGRSNSAPKIGNNVNVGSNVCIIGPISIGDNVTIGAGSVITKDVPANSVIVGNPARIIKRNSEQTIQSLSSVA